MSHQHPNSKDHTPALSPSDKETGGDFFLTQADFEAAGSEELHEEWELPRIQLQPEEASEGLGLAEQVAEVVAELAEPGEHDVFPESNPAFVSLDHQQLRMDLSPQIKLGDVLDFGGLGVIRKGFDLNLQRWVAVKTLQTGKRLDPIAVRRLIEEAQIMAQLDHPSIVPVHKIGLDHDGTLFFTMKLVQGQTFLSLLEEQDFEVRSERELQNQLQVFLKVCDAVAFAHSRGVIHGDLNPTHVMVGDFGQVYVMDWGLAHLKNQVRPSERGDVYPIDWEITRRKERALAQTKAAGDAGPLRPSGGGWLNTSESQNASESWSQEEHQFGLLGYIAPEQTRKQRALIDERTDVFALGGLLYKILTKQPVYQMESLTSVLAQASQGAIIPPAERTGYELPKKLCAIAERALKRQPEDRFATVQELQEQVREFLESGWQFKRRLFAANETIVREGDLGHEAFIITKGRCRVYKTVGQDKVVLRDMEAGDVFGETAVFSNSQTRTASVEALEPVTLAVVTEQHFEEDLGIGYWLGLFVRSLAERFRERDQVATEQTQHLDTTPLGFKLLQHVLQAGNATGATWSVPWSPIALWLESEGVEGAGAWACHQLQELGLSGSLDLENNILLVKQKPGALSSGEGV